MLQYRRLRAPQEHGQTLLAPPWEQAASLLAENRQAAASSHLFLGGQTLRQWSADARADLLRQARQYTSAYRDLPAETHSPEAPLILAGHQPQWFHPGVWFKNFALSELGIRLGASAVNLLIDNDVMRTAAIVCPAGSPSQPYRETLPLDRGGPEIPYEHRRVLDRSLWDSFPQRAADIVAPFSPRPLVRQLWPFAEQAARRSPLLGRRLAEARHALEGQWGLQTLELPLSQVCQTPAFAVFVAYLLSDLPRLRSIYNEGLAEYRRVNRIRSRSHPAPDLEADGDWLEAPFWISGPSVEFQRRRLFARRSGEMLELSDRGRIHLRLPVLSESGFSPETWLNLDPGVQLRPRALTATLYARLFLGDLFLHGIGGAKYDQLTDLLIARFWELRPPGLMAISATALLQEPSIAHAKERLREAQQQLRRLHYHPEAFMPEGSAPELIEQKREQVAMRPHRGEGKPRRRKIEAINQALREHVQMQRQTWEEERGKRSGELRIASLLASREYSLCLFSEERLRPLLAGLAGG